MDYEKAKKYAERIAKALPQEGLGTNEYIMGLATVLAGMCEARGMPVPVQRDLMDKAREGVAHAALRVDGKDN